MRLGFSSSLSDKDLKEMEERKDALAILLIRDHGKYISPEIANDMRRIVIDIDELLDQVRIMKRYISINLR